MAASSYHSSDPPPRTDLWWDHVPSLKIVRPPKGVFSPQADERCFTYCSQSITGRAHGNKPWCRSICLRRVFPHEVSRVLAIHRTQTVTSLPGDNKPIVRVKEEVQAAPVNHPLPPEGQRYSGWLDMLLDGFTSNKEHPPTHEDLPQHPPPGSEPRYWHQGWYIWWSKSSWAVQEKLDVMRRDLQRQTEWQHFKDKKNDEWGRGYQLYEQPGAQDIPQSDMHALEVLGNGPPFPDVSAETILLPLPSPPTSLTALKPALAPSGRVLALVRESVQSGAQRELWGRIWEKARSDEPMHLLGVAWERVMDNFFGEKGGGKE